MNLNGKQVSFKTNHNSNFHPYRILFLLAVIFGMVFFVRAIDAGMVKRPYDPTATPTRTNRSFELEAQTHFRAGNLNAAIAAYQSAIELNPENPSLYAELARLQVYSSASLSTDDEKTTRLHEALDVINKAAELFPDDSNVHAVRAFVLDWNANPIVSGNQSESMLTQAEQAAVRAIQLDPQNTLALVYYAEVLMDSKKYDQAQQYIDQALQRGSDLIDAHRVRGQMYEINGQYLDAVEEYKKALQIMPNMTFLYVYIGLNYRVMAANNPESPYYESALENFASAAKINNTLGIRDPIPYLAIAKTYSQKGDHFAAALNGRKALAYNPANADVYGQLGITYFQGKNYEGAIPALKCAIRGCTPTESCKARNCDEEKDEPISIAGLPLSNSTVVYYYTYGSVLAGLSRKTENYCPDARAVFGEVKAKYGNDTDIMRIVNDGLAICTSLDAP